jgi:circadian clock protein KaiB
MSETEPQTFRMTLYVTGDSAKAQSAMENLRAILDAEYPDQYRLDVVDILAVPEEAERQGILATPTLIKSAPPPERRVIGDFSDRDKVLAGLGVGMRIGGHPPEGEP